MPYNSEKMKLSDTQKRSRKLSDIDRLAIIKRYGDGGIVTQKQLATEYNVSRRTIGFILHPEQLQANYQRRLDRGGWKQYYDKDVHARRMKEYRHYKQNLHINGELH